MLHLTNLSGGNSGGGSTIAYVSDAADDVNRITYTFSAQDIGAENDDRLVIVGVSWFDTAIGTKINSASIGGISASIHTGQKSNNDFNMGADIISATVPSSTSANIVITMNVSVSNAQITVYRATGLTSSTPHDTDNYRGDNSTGATMSVNIPSGGILVAVSGTATDTLTAGWTGATEDIDKDAGEVRQSAASESGLTLESARSVTILWSGSADNAGAVATWS